MNRKICNIIFKVLIHLFLLVASFFLFVSLFFLTFYIHETGHMLYGFFNNLILGKGISTFTITHWSTHPLLPFIKLPQRTLITSGEGSANFALGGPIVTILVVIFISFWIFKVSRNKVSWLIPIPVILEEIIGNIICGTDNLTNNPLKLCSELPLNWLVIYSSYIFFLIMFVIFLQSKSYRKIFNYIYNLPIHIRSYFMAERKITRIKPINVNDPQKEKKIKYIEGVTRIGDLINSINRDIENRILIFISVIISGLLGILLTKGYYLISELLGGILLLLLLITLVKENNDKKQLYKQMNVLVSMAKKDVNLDLKQF